MNGTIKKKTDRGFGFISREGEARDLFFKREHLLLLMLKILKKDQQQKT